MKTENLSFKYTTSTKIVSWGCRFDSLTELKFAISIFEDYEFLRERVAIYYHRGSREPTDKLSGPYRYYIPDFLIRHKVTGEAFLIEVKPRGFQDEPQLALRTELAEKYIRWKGYDWKFKVVFDDEIILNEEQMEDFMECRRLKSKSAYTLWFDQYNRKMDRSTPSPLINDSPEARVRFIMFGHTMQPGGWRQ